MSDLQYHVDYAKSRIAFCRICRDNIELGVLRIGIKVQSELFDGKQLNWHHETCFFENYNPASVCEIGNFNTLNYEDQQRLEAIIENQCQGQRLKRHYPEIYACEASIFNFFIEYSSSNKATCRHCDIKICKGEINIRMTLSDTEMRLESAGYSMWHHLECFKEVKSTLMFFAGGEDIPGFQDLSEEDQEIVKEKIIALREVPRKKFKDEPNNENQEGTSLKTRLENQHNEFDVYRDSLEQYCKADLQEILRENSQATSGGVDELRVKVADMMAFGALSPCPKCQGQLLLDTFTYKCSGDKSEWAKCQYVTHSPERQSMCVPEGFEDSPAFCQYTPKVGVRLFTTKNNIKKEGAVPPLKGLQFFLFGKMENKKRLRLRILKLGGICERKVSETLAAVVATKEAVNIMTLKMDAIKEAEIEVIEPSFFDLIDPDDGCPERSLELIKENNIASWGSDPARRVPLHVMDAKSYKNVKPSKNLIKMLLKGGSAVDPKSGLCDVAHVYRAHNGTKYTVVLGRTDVVTQKNSYYKLQVLEADTKRRYWVYCEWGRIGTDFGDYKKQSFESVEEAITNFENIYHKKTKNYWENRDVFRKAAGAYYPVEVEYSHHDAVLAVDARCKLPEAVQTLVGRIFDIHAMGEVLLEFELDIETMPLGKLSTKQITEGYNILSDLHTHLTMPQPNQEDIIEFTNRFFTTIPHGFGENNPPLLDNFEYIRKKRELLDNLREIKIAYTLMDTDSKDTKSVIEQYYSKLNTEIAPLASDSPEFQMILEYMTNTHSPTHSGYTLELMQVSV